MLYQKKVRTRKVPPQHNACPGFDLYQTLWPQKSKTPDNFRIQFAYTDIKEQISKQNPEECVSLTALGKKVGQESERRGKDWHSTGTPATNWPGTR